MKSLLVSILCVAIFFVGLGTLADKAGAALKSDEKALALIKAARQAIGGDSAIANVRSLTVSGKTAYTTKVSGVDRTEQGESEIAMQLPDKFSRIVKIGRGNAANGEVPHLDKQIIVVGEDVEKVMGASDGSGPVVNKVIVRKPGDGSGQPGTKEVSKVIIRTADGEKVVSTDEAEPGTGGDQHVFIRKAGGAHPGGLRENEMLRTMLGLLVSTPAGMDVSYIYSGEGSVDGTACNIVEVRYSDTSLKLFLGRDSNLPVMMTYASRELPKMVRFDKKAGADNAKGTLIFREKLPTAELAEIQVKFSDYRTVGGLQLPFRWAKTVNGSAAELFEVMSYDINPANIAEKFQHQKVMVRTKAGQQ